MFQYQIYPSGNVSEYTTRVNSISGVSAILDHRMGIIESSLSGIAFYIKSINDYINQNNVGTSGLLITSGYFNHIGFTEYNSYDNSYPYVTTIDGVVSGVSNIYSSGVIIYDSKPNVRLLTTNSGNFSNVIFDNVFVSDYKINNFIFGNLQNLYSGYISDDTTKRLNQNQPLIISELDYPYNLSSSGILNNIRCRYRIDSANNETGIVDGLLISNIFNFNSSQNINVSGNLLILGLYKPNLSLYSVTTPCICESLFQLKSHTHDGVSSSKLKISNFNSSKSTNDHFSLVQSSGDLITQKGYYGNDVGLSSNWEIVDFPNIDIAQKLFTCKDRLYVLDNIRLTEVETGNFIEGTTGQQYPRALVAGTQDGDQPILLEMLKGRDFYLSDPNDINNVVYIRVTLFKSNEIFDLNFKYTGASSDFNIVKSRKEICMDRGIRIGSKIYFTLLEEIDTMKVLTLYEINTITKPLSMKAVAHYELSYGGFASDWRFIKPIKYNNCIYYFFRNDFYVHYLAVYNTIHRPQKDVTTLNFSTMLKNDVQIFEQSLGKRYGFNIFDSSAHAYIESVGLSNINIDIGNKIRKHNNYTYHMGKVFIFGGDSCSRFSQSSRNRINMNYENAMIDTKCLISYAGKMWYGAALEISNDNNNIITHTKYLDKLKTLTNLSSPWLQSPIIYRGWLYCIAPTVPYVSDSFAMSWLIDDFIPAGSLIVRRRSSESELSNMLNLSL